MSSDGGVIIDGLVKSLKSTTNVIPAKAGIQVKGLVPGLRRDDVWTPIFTGVTTSYEVVIISLQKKL